MNFGRDSLALESGAIELADEDRRRLEEAFHRLEHPSFAAHLAHVIGTPVDKGLKLIPPRWHGRFSRSLQTAIGRLLKTVVNRLGRGRPRSERFYRYLGRSAGALGGSLGGPALLVELPLTSSPA